MTAPILRCLLIGAVLAGLCLLPTSTSQPAYAYAFTIPPQYFGCLKYEMREGEKFANFEVRQPTQFIMNRKTKLHYMLIEASYFCDSSVLADSVHVTIDGMSIDTERFR